MTQETNGPLSVDLKGGEEYYWCKCGKSANQPWCDGSHVGSGTEPMRYKPVNDMKVRLCGCKKTGKPPFCDGSHLKK